MKPDPVVIVADALDEDAVSSRANAADLPHPKWKSSERSVQPGPVRRPVQRGPGTGRQMKTTPLIRALSEERAGRADIAGRNQPDAGKRHRGPGDKALDNLREDALHRCLSGDRECDRLQGFGLHSSTLQRVLGMRATTFRLSNDISFFNREDQCPSNILKRNEMLSSRSLETMFGRGVHCHEPDPARRSKHRHR